MRKNIIGKIFKVELSDLHLFGKFVKSDILQIDKGYCVYIKIKTVNSFDFYYDDFNFHEIKNEKIIIFNDILRNDKLKRIIKGS